MSDEPLTALVRRAPAPVAAPADEAAVEVDLETLFADLYRDHRADLVRLAALLLDGTLAAEDVVQEAYISCYGSRARLRDPAKGLAYLRRAVVNTARSRVRKRVVAARHAPLPMPDAPAAEAGAWAALERDAVIAGLRQLARRQREALVLRYYGDLSEAETARIMGCSVGSVKAYTSRGLTALAATLEGKL